MNSERTYLARRLTYSTIYLVLIGWPLYRIYLGMLLTPQIYQYALLSLSFLILLGLLKDRSELIITYYVTAAIVLQVNHVGIPSVGELLIYSLIILHGDMIVKTLIYGVGLRKVRTSVKGYVVSAGFIGISLIAFLIGGYLSAALFIGLEKASVTSTSLSEVVLKPFLNTRVGSITVIILSAMLTSYILTEYFGGVTTDIIGLNPEYARRRIRAALSKAYKSVVFGKAWHDRLWRYSVLTFLSLVLWAATIPAYRLGVGSVPYLMKLLNSEELSGITQLLSFITGVALAYVAYRAIRKVVAKAFLPKPLTSRANVPKASYKWLLISLVALAAYLLILFRSPPLNSGPYSTLLRTLRLSSPRPGSSWPVLDSFINSLPRNVNQYIQGVVNGFNWLTYIARLIMNILWGG